MAEIACFIIHHDITHGLQDGFRINGYNGAAVVLVALLAWLDRSSLYTVYCRHRTNVTKNKRTQIITAISHQDTFQITVLVQSTSQKLHNVCDISGSRGDKLEDCLLGCCTVQRRRDFPTFPSGIVVQNKALNGLGMKRSQPILRYYPKICLVGLRKPQQN
jgi:hypothetical protein